MYDFNGNNLKLFNAVLSLPISVIPGVRMLINEVKHEMLTVKVMSLFFFHVSFMFHMFSGC